MSDARPDELVPAVGAVVRDDDGRILAVRDRDLGAWTLPLGHVEPGEDVRTAVRREVREEAGVEVAVDRLSGVYSDPEEQVVEREGAEIQFVTTVVVCTHESGSPEGDGKETTAARFFERESLPEMAPLDEWVEDALSGDGPTLS